MLKRSKPTSLYGRIFFLLLFLGLAILFARLGLWQLDRAEQSRNVTQMVRNRATLPPVVVNNGIAGESDLAYRVAIAEGRFEPNKAIFLDGKKETGKLGYHLVVPFHLEGGRQRILVNRGWVSEPEPLTNRAHSTRIRGVLIRPTVPPLRLGNGKSGKGQILPYLDLESYSGSHDHPVEPLILLEDGKLSDEALSRGLDRADKWGMHIGYAIQWFVFSFLAGVLMMLAPSRQRRQPQ